MILETERLILRPWVESDATSLYEYAKNPKIGPMCGWPIHSSVENSRLIIEHALAQEETYAITIKPNDEAVGSLGIMFREDSNIEIGENEAEIGYWIAEPFWGHNYIPEAVQEALRHAFEELKLSAIWCGYFEGNEKSRRVNEKAGFHYQFLAKDIEWPLIAATHSLHVTKMTKAQWEEQRNGII